MKKILENRNKKMYNRLIEENDANEEKKEKKQNENEKMCEDYIC